MSACVKCGGRGWIYAVDHTASCYDLAYRDGCNCSGEPAQVQCPDCAPASKEVSDGDPF